MLQSPLDSPGRVAELADAQDSGSCVLRGRGGSSPPSPTTHMTAAHPRPARAARPGACSTAPAPRPLPPRRCWWRAAASASRAGGRASRGRRAALGSSSWGDAAAGAGRRPRPPGASGDPDLAAGLPKTEAERTLAAVNARRHLDRGSPWSATWAPPGPRRSWSAGPSGRAPWPAAGGGRRAGGDHDGWAHPYHGPGHRRGRRHAGGRPGQPGPRGPLHQGGGHRGRADARGRPPASPPTPRPSWTPWSTRPTGWG